MTTKSSSKPTKKKATASKEDGIHGQCDVCGRDIYTFMELNCKVMDEIGMCAVCTWGEADLITD